LGGREGTSVCREGRGSPPQVCCVSNVGKPAPWMRSSIAFSTVHVKSRTCRATARELSIGAEAATEQGEGPGGMRREGPSGRSDGGASCATEQGQGCIAQGRQDLWSAPRPEVGMILAEDDITQPVLSFDAPMAANECEQAGRISLTWRATRDEVRDVGRTSASLH
jgi:hypothetical protein